MLNLNLQSELSAWSRRDLSSFHGSEDRTSFGLHHTVFLIIFIARSFKTWSHSSSSRFVISRFSAVAKIERLLIFIIVGVHGSTTGWSSDWSLKSSVWLGFTALRRVHPRIGMGFAQSLSLWSRDSIHPFVYTVLFILRSRGSVHPRVYAVLFILVFVPTRSPSCSLAFAWYSSSLHIRGHVHLSESRSSS